MVNLMKQESIRQTSRSVVISSIVDLCIRIAIICIWITKFEVLVNNSILHTIIWLVIITLAVQALFLPYLTWLRIKEIRKGEYYEASKY